MSIGVVYVELLVAAPNALLGASTAIATSVEMHVTQQSGGTAQMRQMERVALSSATPLRMAPGGLHFMLIGLQQPLQAGSHFPLTLHFERSADLTIDVAVLSADSDGAS